MHPLLTTLRRTNIALNIQPTEAFYDVPAGVWMGPDGPVSDDPKRMPVTKKNDLETGEDQKGQ